MTFQINRETLRHLSSTPAGGLIAFMRTRPGTTLQSNTLCKAKSDLRLTPMPSGAEKQFEEYAQCCSELAREADTAARRERLLKMAREYMQAAELLRHGVAARVMLRQPSPNGGRKGFRYRRKLRAVRAVR